MGMDGMEVVRQSVKIFDNYHLPAQVLAASIRMPNHVTEAALAGAHVSTLPWSVLQAMVKHPLTDIGIERFLADSRKYSSV
jgi:transaldolase